MVLGKVVMTGQQGNNKLVISNILFNVGSDHRKQGHGLRYILKVQTREFGDWLDVGSRREMRVDTEASTV